jgi:hypothetical protein
MCCNLYTEFGMHVEIFLENETPAYLTELMEASANLLN